MSRIAASTLITAFIFFVTSLASAEVYKWIDADGKIHYSDKKINKSAEKVDIKQNIANDAEQRLNKQKKYLNYLQSEREQRQKNKMHIREQQAKQKKHCLILRDNLKSLTQERVIWYELDENTGERRYLTDKELEKQIQELESKIKTNCS